MQDPLQERLYDGLSGASVLMLGTANVVMQLARLPVGRGVAESTVESGRVDRHPVKRARTTIAYLTVALFGTEAERAAYRREVNRSHRPVHSGPESDVAYNAFDPELQLWVAACIYLGSEQAIELADPGMLDDDEEFQTGLYSLGSRFGTTLQVPEDMWPADREQFTSYWQEGLQQIEMDDVTRTYLYDLASLRFLPAPLSWVFGAAHRFMVAGFLPDRFREELGLRWSPRRRSLHDGITAVVMRLNRWTPGPIRRFPLNFYLWDTRRRIAAGKAIV